MQLEELKCKIDKKISRSNPDETGDFWENNKDDIWSKPELRFFIDKALHGNSEDVEELLTVVQSTLTKEYISSRGRLTARPPSRKTRTTIEADIQFNSDETHRSKLLGDYFTKLAECNERVKRFRCAITQQVNDGRGDAVNGCLDDRQASDLVRSLACRYLSYSQFLHWSIPIIGHKARICETPRRVEEQLLEEWLVGEIRVLRIDPPGEVFVIRSSAPIIDGFRHDEDSSPPNFPAMPRSYCAPKYVSITDSISENSDCATNRLESQFINAGEMSLEDNVNQAKEMIYETEVFAPTRRQGFAPRDRILRYIREDQYIESVQVWPGSVLDELREVSEELANDFHWNEAEAVRFILTGKPPIVRPLQLTSTTIVGGDFNDAFIKMRVLPWVSWTTIKKLYTKTQRHLLGGENRRPADRALRVFEFVTREAGAKIKDDNWRELSGKWNSMFPNDKYSRPSDFKQSYQRAKQSLLMRYGSQK